MRYYITRQARIDASHIVEITPEDQAINGDILRSDYKGESELYTDPISASETAILIRRSWQRDEPHTNIIMAVGSADGYHPMTADDLRQWAIVQLDLLPPCEWCGNIIYQDAVKYAEGIGAPVRYFCSVGCALGYQDDTNTPTDDRAGEAADAELDHAEQVTRRDIDFQSENRQNV